MQTRHVRSRPAAAMTPAAVAVPESPDMKHLSLILTLFSAAPLFAQGGVISASTATDYAVLAGDGTSSGFDSVAVNTPLGPGLAVHAGVGGSASSSGAMAATAVMRGAPAGSNFPNTGLTIHETGRAVSTDPNASLSAGTSGDAPGMPSPVQGSHAIALDYAVPANATGHVLVQWMARASTAGSLTASVDADGDGNAEWTGTAAAPDRRSIAVTAGATGIHIVISTSGQVALSGSGNEGYDGVLSVAFVPATGGLTCTWTSFGPSCVGTLQGSDVPGATGIRLTLAVGGATPSTVGVLVLGTAATTPTPLPGGVCDLLIDRGGRPIFTTGFHTDAQGAATILFQIPARALSIDMQALTFDRANQSIGSTNGLGLVCR